MAPNCELIDSLERQWRDSLCASDVQALRSLIHPRFTLIGTRSTGPFTLNREEWLVAVQKRVLVSIDLDIKDPVVPVDVTVGTVQARARAVFP